MRKSIGLSLIALGITILLFVTYANSPVSKQTRIYSPYSLLTSSWEKYKARFINNQGRSIDPAQQNITTSEAQSYALLRAVWVDDKQTFDKVYAFTNTHLKRQADHLFGWRFGSLSNGMDGFLPEGGSNSASDADSDIAFALVLAGRRWNNPSYLSDAKMLIRDVWKIETATASGKRYLIAGNWAKNQQQLIINVSYFAPYEWRVFAEIDKQDDWLSLIGPAYELLQQAGTAPLDMEKGVGLPPDWLAMDRLNGSLSPPAQSNLTTRYSFDAMRTPWRVSLDYQWNKDAEVYRYLMNSYSLLSHDYTKHRTLAQAYSHDGKRLTDNENPVMYATALGYFLAVNKNIAGKIYQDKIIRLYSNDQNTFNPNLSYYEQNWLWFGAALYNNYLKNFQ